MHITSISIRNFRSFGNEPKTLRACPGLNVLVGENNNGKSTIFAALDQALKMSVLQWNDAPWGSTVNEFAISIAVALGDDAQGFVDQISGGPSPRNGELTSILRESPVTVTLTATPTGVTSRLHVGQIDILQRGKKAQLNKPWRQFATALPADAPLLKSLQAAQENVTFAVDPTHLLASQLRERLRRFADVRLRPVEGTERNVTESFDGRATGVLLFNLKNGNATERRRYERLQERFAQFFPGYGFECNRDENGNCRVVLVRLDREFDILSAQAGTGLFEILTVIANLEDRERNILVVEEPGAHLHPQAQRALQRLIVESAKKNQIFVITHSPEFVNWAGLDGLARIWLKGPESQISQISEAELNDKERAVLVESLRDPRRREVLSREEWHS